MFPAINGILNNEGIMNKKGKNLKSNNNQNNIIFIIINKTERGGINSITNMLQQRSDLIKIERDNRNTFKLLISSFLKGHTVVFTSPKLLLYYFLLIFIFRNNCIYWPHHLPHLQLDLGKFRYYIYSFIEFLFNLLKLRFIFVSDYQSNSYRKFFRNFYKNESMILPPTLGGFKRFNSDKFSCYKKELTFSIFSRFDNDPKTFRLKDNLNKFLKSINYKDVFHLNLFGDGAEYDSFCNYFEAKEKIFNFRLHKKNWCIDLEREIRNSSIILVEGEGETFHLISALAIIRKIPILNLTKKHPLNYLINKNIIHYKAFKYKNNTMIDLQIAHQVLLKNAKDNFFKQDIDEELYLETFLNFCKS